MHSKLLRAAVAALLGGGLVVAGAHADAAPTASSAPLAASSGWNDWDCQPSAAHPNPVVMLHGLGGNGPGNWAYMGPRLRDAGYCAFNLTYGTVAWWIPLGGLRPIAESAEQIADFVDDVRDATSADEVDIVGHSEGGFLSLYLPKMLDVEDEVGKVVALAPPTKGNAASPLVEFADLIGARPYVDIVLRQFGCDACSDLIRGGPAVVELNDGPIAQPGVDYTVVASRFDILVVPQEESFVQEAGVHNLFVQDVCPVDPVGHIGMAFDTSVEGIIKNALDPGHPQPVNCGIGPPI